MSRNDCADPAVVQAVVEKHADALFKASHAAAFGVRVQALALLLQLLTAQSAASDRFYRRALLLTGGPWRDELNCKGSWC